ncbi:hypothetical protein Pst134EA_022552 [Puccinia striiformis f. sp. tritici]|uniref:hypothetical protein n=1 Tax=Puccinia striiformis f. sp. tritici TaxID=168172 RepID=UPI0020087639|nr:hypothetical protein Pst134EA_022552 [Puccinia striiformis f. sp. tritici]KAH9455076.1 hypothetical protein Pst134EA_022552 [Puccinia striiformis f. sp. tritici]
MPSRISSSLQVDSFRYSADRGLVPLLSETAARLLAVAQSNRHTLSFPLTQNRGLVPLLSKSTAKSLTSNWKNATLRGTISPIRSDRHACSYRTLTPNSLSEATNPQPSPSNPPVKASTNSPINAMAFKPCKSLLTPAVVTTFDGLAGEAIDNLADLEFVHTQPLSDLTPPTTTLASSSSHGHLLTAITATNGSIDSPSSPPKLSKAWAEPSIEAIAIKRCVSTPNLTVGSTVNNAKPPTELATYLSPINSNHSPVLSESIDTNSILESPSPLPLEPLTTSVTLLSNGSPNTSPPCRRTFDPTFKPLQHRRTRSLASSSTASLADLTFIRDQPFTEFLSLATAQSHSSDRLPSSELKEETIPSLPPTFPQASHAITLTQRSNIANIASDCLSGPATDSTAIAPLPTLAPVSDSPFPTFTATSEPHYNNLELAMVGGIEIVNDDDPALDFQPAPEFLEYYDDEGNCFTLPKIYETEKKKNKKKKKKKTTTSRSNPSLPSPSVEVQASAVGVSKEALAALERLKDPRSRPIEDSDFIGWDDCIDGPTSTVDNLILFYV